MMKLFLMVFIIGIWFFIMNIFLMDCWVWGFGVL